MRNALSTFFSGLVGQIVPADDMVELADTDTNTTIDLLQNIDRARQDWFVAKKYFDYVTDPDLIDMAIYSIEAAEKRYMYLLKMARTKGLRLDHPDVVEH